MNERETVQKAYADEPKQDAMGKRLDQKRQPEYLEHKLLSTEKKLYEAEKRIIALENESTVLLEKLTAADRNLERMTERVFDSFKSDENISFYTSFPKYATFVATYKFLNPGVHGENIRYCSSSERAIPADFYDDVEEEDLETEQQNAKIKREDKKG